MLKVDTIAPGTLRMVAAGELNDNDIKPGLDALRNLKDGSDQINLLVEVEPDLDVKTLEVIGEEIKLLSDLPGLVSSLNKVAVVADQDWLRNAAKIEGLMLPNVDYETFERDEANEARSWVQKAA